MHRSVIIYSYATGRIRNDVVSSLEVKHIRCRAPEIAEKLLLPGDKKQTRNMDGNISTDNTMLESVTLWLNTNTSPMDNGTFWPTTVVDQPVAAVCEGNTTAKYMFLQSLRRLQSGILGSYLITMIVGLVGNMLVIYVIGRNAQIRNKSVANYYICNLAFADLFFVLTMPLFCYATFSNDWPFGTSMCKLSKVFFETNRYASMFTLVALSADRYLASFYNMGHLRTVKAGIIVCCVIWILCGTVSIPYWIHATVKNRQCITTFSTEFMTIWIFVQLTLALLLPFTLICVSYILLAVRLQMILKATAARSVQKPSKKMIRTVLVVIIVFVVCQVPWHGHEILSWKIHMEYAGGMCLPSLQELKLAMYLNTVSTILGFISSCVNPIIYGILNDNYRKQYQAVVCCCCIGAGGRRLALDKDSQSMSVRATAAGTQTHLSSASCRFRMPFTPPCLGQENGHHRSNRHRQLSTASSQDCSLLHTAATEHIEMVIDEEDEDVKKAPFGEMQGDC